VGTLNTKAGQDHNLLRGTLGARSAARAIGDGSRFRALDEMDANEEADVDMTLRSPKSTKTQNLQLMGNSILGGDNIVSEKELTI